MRRSFELPVGRLVDLPEIAYWISKVGCTQPPRLVGAAFSAQLKVAIDPRQTMLAES